MVMTEANKPRKIKRYSNRKLYDTKESQYITLDEIANLVKAGEEIQILDNRNGNDLTEVTLAQILFEEQKKQTMRMSLQALKEIIRSGGSTISDFIQKRLAQPVQTLKEEAERKVDHIRDVFSGLQKGLDDVQKKVDDRIHSIAGGSRAMIRDQLSSLRKRIEEIEAKLKED